MTRLIIRIAAVCLALGVAVAAAFSGARWVTRTAVEVPDHTASAEAGAYLFAAAGCATCHTAEGRDATPLAGGRELATPFGTFYGPNITPHAEHGIGSWSDADFIRALRQGVAPDGRDYYPAFPYASYTRLSDADLLDLKAYLFSLPAAAEPNRAHDLPFPFGFRPLLTFWKLLYLEEGPMAPEPGRSEMENRGAYLVQAAGHCGECHSPRNALGAPIGDMALAGTEEGPEGRAIPNITPHRETGIGRWSADDIVFLLRAGMLPDGDFVGGGMGEVVSENTSHLTEDDLRAIAAYLQMMPAVENAVGASDDEDDETSRSDDDW